MNLLIFFLSIFIQMDFKFKLNRILVQDQVSRLNQHVWSDFNNINNNDSLIDIYNLQ